MGEAAWKQVLLFKERQGGLCPLRSGLDDFAVCCRNVATCVVDVASHHVVGEVRLQNNVLGVHVHLEDVVPRLHISYVDPLAVNVRIVCVIAAWTQALRVRGAGIALEVAEVTGAVLQAEAGLVPRLPSCPWMHQAGRSG